MLKSSSKAFRKNKSKKRKRNSNSLQIKQFLTIDALKAFEKLKICFIEEFLLNHFDFRCKFRVKIDAFNKIIDDVFCQQILNNDD